MLYSAATTVVGRRQISGAVGCGCDVGFDLEAFFYCLRHRSNIYVWAPHSARASTIYAFGKHGRVEVLGAEERLPPPHDYLGHNLVDQPCEWLLCEWVRKSPQPRGSRLFGFTPAKR
jgi:hypothetical protein